MYFSILRNFGSNVTKGHFKRKTRKSFGFIWNISRFFVILQPESTKSLHK